mgnify:CR=1 FL=1
MPTIKIGRARSIGFLAVHQYKKMAHLNKICTENFYGMKTARDIIEKLIEVACLMALMVV